MQSDFKRNFKSKSEKELFTGIYKTELISPGAEKVLCFLIIKTSLNTFKFSNIFHKTIHQPNGMIKA